MGRSDEQVYYRGQFLPKEGGVASNLRVEELVGYGAFAELYNCYDVVRKQNFACKVEKPRQDGSSKLKKEAALAEKLARKLNTDRIDVVPHFHGWQGCEKGPWMQLDLLGRDLSKVRKLVKNHKLSMCSTGFLGKQLIQHLRKVHDLGIIHRDIKPQNCMLGNNSETKIQLYLVDFGLARDDFKNPKPHPLKNVSFRGTAAYASLRSLQNIEQGKRDDLEGVFWVMVDLLLGGVPWRKISVGKSKERDQKIREGKTSIFEALTDVNSGKVSLCHANGFNSVYSGPFDQGTKLPCNTVGLSGLELLEAMPPQMVRMLTNISQLEFDASPNYDFLFQCFLDLEKDGDTEAFRARFKGSSRYEAITKEILGNEWNEKSWNTITVEQPQASQLKRRRSEMEEQVAEDHDDQIAESLPASQMPTPEMNALESFRSAQQAATSSSAELKNTNTNRTSSTRILESNLVMKKEGPPLKKMKSSPKKLKK